LWAFITFIYTEVINHFFHAFLALSDTFRNGAGLF
jgi:hypothetical protein